MSQSILVVAGEASGDNLGSAIIKAWKEYLNKANQKNKTPQFWGFGGKAMEEMGVTIHHTVDELATIGFWEAFVNYRKLKGYANELVKQCIEKNVQHAILIDYPGFNLHLAKKLNKLNIKCYLIVSPQIWAWHYSRIHKIRETISKVLCLYHFETEIFDRENVPSHFIGHPVTEKIEHNKKVLKEKAAKLKKRYKAKKIIALLPGSRMSEISRHLPFMIEAAKELHKNNPDIVFFMPTATAPIHEMVTSYELPDYIKLFPRESHLVLLSSDAALACSGTVTLECALFKLPFVLIYKTSRLTYRIGKMLLTSEHIGIVNIIQNKEVCKEFVQHKVQIAPILDELRQILYDKKYIKMMIKQFDLVEKDVHQKNSSLTAAKELHRLTK